MRPTDGPYEGRAFTAALVAIVTVATSYVVARAAHVPLTFDEAGVLLTNVTAGPTAVFDFATAQNHFLHTLLAWLATPVVGPEWGIRLPSVLGGALYLASVVAMVRALERRAIALAGAVVAIANPYLLEYFALGRGYGLSVGLLMAAVACHLRWYRLPRSAGTADAHFAWGLGLATASVAANFTALPAFVGILGLAGLRILRDPAKSAECPPSRISKRGRATAGMVVAAVATWAFAYLVFEREPVLGADDLAPVRVTLHGAYDDELDYVSVFRKELAGVTRQAVRRADGTWTLRASHYPFEGLRIVLPPQLDRDLAAIDVSIGRHTYTRSGGEAGPWKVLDAGLDRILTSTPDLRWRPDALHRRRAAVHASAVLALLIVGGLVLNAALVAGQRVRVVLPGERRALVAAVFAAAAVSTAPLYLLRRDGELFFGGTRGLVADTFGSLMAGTIYGSTVGSTLMACAGLALVVAVAWPIAVVYGIFTGRSTPLSPAPVAGVFVAICSIALALQLLLGTPYPDGRTALGLLPLALWYLVLAANATATLGHQPRRFATVALGGLAAGLALHAVAVANVTRAIDWPGDAGTKAAMERVSLTAVHSPVVPGHIRVGVDRSQYTVARFYARRLSNPATQYEVLVLPGDGLPVDVVYGRLGTDVGRGALVSEFADHGMQLWRTRP